MFDSPPGHQNLFRETRARCMGLTVNQWLEGFDSLTRSQIITIGQSIIDFDYDKFQNFVDQQQMMPVQMDKKGWYMPFGVHKKSFISYPNRVKYEANDILLIDYILPNSGYKFAQVNSFVYHFQQRTSREK